VSRSSKSSHLWVTALVVMFLLMAGGAALTYMSIVRPVAAVEAEAATGGGEMAGVNIGYSTSVPIWILC
jgi:uncharacterized protein YpmB